MGGMLASKLLPTTIFLSQIDLTRSNGLWIDLIAYRKEKEIILKEIIVHK